MDKQDFIKESEQTVKNKICLNICVCVDFDRDYSALYCFPRTNIDLVYLFMKNQNENKKSNRTRPYSLPYWLRRFSIHTHTRYSPLTPQLSLLSAVPEWITQINRYMLVSCFDLITQFISMFAMFQSISFMPMNGSHWGIYISFFSLLEPNSWLALLFALFVINHAFFPVWLMIIQSNKKKTHTLKTTMQIVTDFIQYFLVRKCVAFNYVR